MPPGPTGKVRADGARDKFLRGATAIQELIEPMVTGKPYPIKGLVVYGTNLLHTIPNVPRTKDALKALNVRQQSTLIAYKGKAETGRSVGSTDPAAIEMLVGSAI